MPGSFLAKFHDACPITASISSALIDLPSIKEIQVRFGGKEHVPHPFPAGAQTCTLGVACELRLKGVELSRQSVVGVSSTGALNPRGVTSDMPAAFFTLLSIARLSETFSFLADALLAAFASRSRSARMEKRSEVTSALPEPPEPPSLARSAISCCCGDNRN